MLSWRQDEIATETAEATSPSLIRFGAELAWFNHYVAALVFSAFRQTRTGQVAWCTT